MKIIYIVHAFYPESYSGTERFVYNIASQMIAFGHEVKVITYSFYADSLYEKEYECFLLREFDYEGVPVVAYKFKDLTEFDELSLENDRLLLLAQYLLEQENPDIVHIGHPMRTADFMSVCRREDIPYVITLTDFYLICPRIILTDIYANVCSGPFGGERCERSCASMRLPFKDRITMAERYLKDARYVVTPSQFVKDVFTNEMNGLDIHVVNHGIKSGIVERNDRIYSGKDELIFAYAGALTHHKGINVLLKAFGMSKNKPQLKIYGSDNKELFRLLQKKYHNINVELCGVYAPNEINKVLSSVDIVIVPSIWHETYCLVLYEALACNVPVIASNMGALPERVKTGVNGFIFERNNAEQLSKLVDMIVENSHLINTLKNNIRVLPPPSIKEEARCYEELYMLSIDPDKQCVEHSKKENDNKIQSILIDELNEAQWEAHLQSIAAKVRLDTRLLYDMRYRMEYLRYKYKGQQLKYIVWGTGTSGAVTTEFVQEFLSAFKLVGYVDKFKQGIFNDCTIYKPEDLRRLEFDYLFVATTPGKVEAEKILSDLGLNLIDDYIFGYGVN